MSSLTKTDLTGLASTPTQSIYYTYDVFDQVLTASGAAGSMTRAYDSAGNVISQTDSRGSTETYSYDAENRVTQYVDKEGGVWRTSYDAYGSRIAETDPNGRTTRW